MRLVFLVGFLLAATPAGAQDTPELGAEDLELAKTLFENGRTLYREARYREAIIAWEEVYRLTKKPAILYNLGNAHEHLGEFEAAIDAFNRYRAFAEPGERDELERKINNLDRMAREKRDEPTPAPVPATVKPAPEQRAPRERTGSARTVVGVGLVGVGVAAIGTGVVFGMNSRQAGKQALLQCVDVDGQPLCPDTAEADLARNRSSALLADVSTGLGIAGAAVGVVFLATGKGSTVEVGPRTIRFSSRF